MEKLFAQSPQGPKPSKAEQSVLLSIIGSLVSLCTALAEAQDDILEAVAGNSGVNSLLFSVATAKPDVAEGLDNVRSDTLACLMVLSEENQKFAERIMAPKHSQVFQTLLPLKSEVSGDGILACAILQNLYYALQDEQLAGDSDIPNPSVLIPTLTKAIAGIRADSLKSQEDDWSNPIQYQRLALEVLASIGTSLNSAGEDESRDPPKQNGNEAVEDDDDMVEADGDVEDEDVGDVEGSDDDDDMDDDAMQADMDMVTGADDDDTPGQGIDDLPVLKALLHQALPEVIRVASLPTRDEDSVRFQSLALSALNNISWSVSMVDFSDDQNGGIQRVWSPAASSIWQKVITPILSSDTADVTLATQVTGLAWAIARTLRAETPLKPSEHRKFISLYQATRGTEATKDNDDPFQGLGVKCIGVLGQLALDPAPIDLNREIGMFLVTLLASLPETPVADAVEALNQIFDIYADEEFAYDREVFWKDNFLKHLEDVRPKAKAMVKTVDKRIHAELRTRADEALMNLEQFISYKNRHKP